MNYFANAGLLVVDTVFAIVLFVLVLRVVLQLIRANFYNPLSQAIYKLTNPLLAPWAKRMPSVRGINMAPVLLLLVAAVLWGWLHLWVADNSVGPLGVLLFGLARLLGFLLSFFFWIVIVRVLLSWLAADSRSPAIPIIYGIADLVLAPFARMIRPIGGIDLSPLLALLTLQLARLLLVAPLLDLAFCL